MKLEKSERRQKQANKNKYGMRVSGKSVKLLPEIMAKRAENKRK